MSDSSRPPATGPSPLAAPSSPKIPSASAARIPIAPAIKVAGTSSEGDAAPRLPFARPKNAKSSIGRGPALPPPRARGVDEATSVVLPVAAPIDPAPNESMSRVRSMRAVDDVLASEPAPAPEERDDALAEAVLDAPPAFDDGADALPLDAEVPEEHDIVLRWSEALDEVDYLTLLNLPLPADVDDVASDRDVRLAFHEFALRFHPDRYRDAPEDVRVAASQVFRLGTEAYRVLKDPSYRRRYVKLLSEGAGTKRLTPEEIAEALVGDTKKALRVQDMARTAAARPYAMRADELLAAGDLKQAKLQLQLCMMRDPGNLRLDERMKALEAEIGGKK